MRYLLPAAAAAVALSVGAVPAAATDSQHRKQHRAEQIGSHVSLHVSRHHRLAAHQARFSPDVSGNYAVRAYGVHSAHVRSDTSPTRTPSSRTGRRGS